MGIQTIGCTVPLGFAEYGYFRFRLPYLDVDLKASMVSSSLQ